MNYIKIKKHDIANGPGVRVSLYVSGCTRHCRNCFNPETWSFEAGSAFSESTEAEIIEALRPEYIRGLSLLGGEPFDPKNRPALVRLVGRVRELLPEKSIWCYTGYDYEQDILAGHVGDDESAQQLLSMIDVLVDGAFVEEQKVVDLRFRGSLNQRIIDVKQSLKTDDVVLWSDKTQEQEAEKLRTEKAER